MCVFVCACACVCVCSGLGRGTPSASSSESGASRPAPPSQSTCLESTSLDAEHTPSVSRPAAKLPARTSMEGRERGGHSQAAGHLPLSPGEVEGVEELDAWTAGIHRWLPVNPTSYQ